MIRNIQRANQRQKGIMQEIIDGENQLALTDRIDDQYIPEYCLERCGRDWGIVEYVKTVHPECEGMYQVGQLITRGAFTRCTLCGDIDYRWDDECPECLNCNDTGEVPEIDPQRAFYIQMALARRNA